MTTEFYAEFTVPACHSTLKVAVVASQFLSNANYSRKDAFLRGEEMFIVSEKNADKIRHKIRYS
jgi:hypothetical protein